MNVDTLNQSMQTLGVAVGKLIQVELGSGPLRKDQTASAHLRSREGFAVNHKRLFRIYREERLMVRKRGGRKGLAA